LCSKKRKAEHAGGVEEFSVSALTSPAGRQAQTVPPSLSPLMQPGGAFGTGSWRSEEQEGKGKGTEAM
jgi:hypothetical protein